jgi:hypothetical protein
VKRAVIVANLPSMLTLPVQSTCAGPTRGNPLTATAHRGDTYLLPGSWGADTVDEAEQVRSEAYEIYGTLGYKSYPTTLGGLAGRLLRLHMDLPDQKCLRPRYRFICRNYHVGPMTVNRGGSDPNTGKDYYWRHYDRRKAYLHSSAQLIPVVRSLRAYGGERAKKAILTDDALYGFVRAKVFIPNGPYNVGPLPVRKLASRPLANGGRVSRVITVWPLGHVEGTWPVNLIVDAVDNYGAIILEVMEAALTHDANRPLVPYLEAIGLERHRSERVFKGLYQRAWTKFAPSKWWRGVRYEANCVEWSANEVNWLNNRTGRQFMRPDITAYVASYNIQRVTEAANSLPCGAVGSIHVDSIHTTDTLTTGRNEGDWRLEKEGPARFYDVGDYNYTGDPSRYPVHAKEVLMASRVWDNGDMPYLTGAATSNPHFNADPSIEEPRSFSDSLHTPLEEHRDMWDYSVFDGTGWTRNSFLAGLNND